MKLLVYLYAGNDMRENIELFLHDHYIPGIHHLYPSLHIERCNLLSGSSMVTVGHMDDAPPPPAYCAIIEAQMHDADIPVFLQQLKDPALEREARALAADRLECDKIWRIAVEERASPVEQDNEISRDGAMVKQIVNLRKRSDKSYYDFIKYYEEFHAPLTVSTLPMFVKYTRNYLIDNEKLQMSLNPLTQSACDFDVTTHLWFKSEESRKQFASAFNDPAIGQMFAEDSAKLFEPGSMQMFLVNERLQNE